MPEKTESPRYYWWHGKDLCPLFAFVQDCGGAENVRIEFHPKEGLLHVIPLGEADEKGARAPDPSRRRTFNFTHTCPPQCD